MKDFSFFERSVIGACIRDEMCRFEAVSEVNEDCFESKDFRVCFSVIKSLVKDGIDVDIGSVASRFAALSYIPLQDALIFVMDCESIGYTAYFEQHLKEITDRWAKKKLVYQLEKALLESQKEESSFFDLIKDLQDGIADASVQKTNTVKTTNESMDSHQDGLSFEKAFEKRLKDRREGISDLPGIPYGYKGLDEATGGVRPGSIIIVGGRTSIGKTEFCLNLVRYWLEQNIPIGMFSMEMTLSQLDTRLIAQKSFLSVDSVDKADLMPDEIETLYKSCEWYRNSKFFYDSTPGLKPSQIKSRLFYMKQKFGVKIAVLDFLTLMRPDHSSASSHERFGAIIQDLQNVAKEVGVSLLCIAQLNRQNDKENRRPRLTDIRESGALEEAADVAILLHRPDFNDPLNKPGICEVILDKNRHTGKRDIFQFSFDKKSSRFQENDFYGDMISTTTTAEEIDPFSGMWGKK